MTMTFNTNVNVTGALQRNGNDVALQNDLDTLDDRLTDVEIEMDALDDPWELYTPSKYNSNVISWGTDSSGDDIRMVKVNQILRLAWYRFQGTYTPSSDRSAGDPLKIATNVVAPNWTRTPLASGTRNFVGYVTNDNELYIVPTRDLTSGTNYLFCLTGIGYAPVID